MSNNFQLNMLKNIALIETECVHTTKRDEISLYSLVFEYRIAVASPSDSVIP